MVPILASVTARLNVCFNRQAPMLSDPRGQMGLGVAVFLQAIGYVDAAQLPAPRAPDPQPGRAAPALGPGHRQGERLYHLYRDRRDHPLSHAPAVLFL